MEELEVIEYLLKEIKTELKYAENYSIAKKQAEKMADTYNRNHNLNGFDKEWYYTYLPEDYKTEPKKATIKANALKIRQLLLKLYKGE